MSPHIEISVIVPHLNQPDLLSRALSSLQEQSGNIPKYEIIVADNNSRQLPDLTDFPDVTLVIETTPGPGPARNKAVSVARGDILAFIDSDCWAAPNWLSEIASHFAAHPDHDVIGGDITIFIPSDRAATAQEAYEATFTFRNKEMIEQQGFAGTGNMAVRRAMMQVVGGFGGINLSEDRDWGRRATALGHPPHYVEALRVYHPARPDFRALMEKWDRHLVHDLTEARSKPLWWPRWVLRSILVAVSPLIHVTMLWDCASISGIERWKGFAMLIRVRLYRAKGMLLAAFGIGGKTVTRWNDP